MSSGPGGPPQGPPGGQPGQHGAGAGMVTRAVLVVAVVVALVVGLGLGALGGVLLSGDDDSSRSDTARDDGGDSGDDEATEEPSDEASEEPTEAPTEAESVEPPDDGGTEGGEGETIDGLTPPTLDGWDITSVRVSRDFVDDFEVGFEATNTGDAPESVFWTVTLLAAGSEVGELSCTESDVAPGDTVEVTCYTGDDFRDDVDEVRVEEAF